MKKEYETIKNNAEEAIIPSGADAFDMLNLMKRLPRKGDAYFYARVRELADGGGMEEDKLKERGFVKTSKDVIKALKQIGREWEHSRVREDVKTLLDTGAFLDIIETTHDIDLAYWAFENLVKNEGGETSIAKEFSARKKSPIIAISATATS